MEDGGKVIYIFLNIFLNLKHELRQGGRKHMTLVKNLEVFFFTVARFLFFSRIFFKFKERREIKYNKKAPKEIREKKRGVYTSIRGHLFCVKKKRKTKKVKGLSIDCRE